MFPEFVYTFILGECYIILFQLDLSYQVLFLKLVIGLYPNLEIDLLYGWLFTSRMFGLATSAIDGFGTQILSLVC